MRHLVICCDGTWNRADQSKDGVPTPTNVRLFHNLLAARGQDRGTQVVQYFSGVGADGSAASRFVDGGTGNGLYRNIMNAYMWLAREYRPGDLISAVGFSRGAYTVRSVVAMLTCCGLVSLPPDGRGSWRTVRRVFEDGYQDRTRNPDWADGLQFHDGFGPPSDHGEQEVLGERIEFLGVWDTVGSLGIPDQLGLLNLFDEHDEVAFVDTHLNPGVRCARHAVALDERRGPFAPTLWTTPEGEVHQDPPRVVQTWFPGVHSDVGGGYREHGLSDGALRWMIDEAAAHSGLAFTGQAKRIEGDAFDVLHDSCTGFYERLAPVPRNVPRVDGGDSSVHESAVARHKAPPPRQDRYRPTEDVPRDGDGPPRTVPVFAHETWSATGLYLERGTYELTAEGEWVDKDDAAGPGGVVAPTFLGRVARGFGDLAGAAEYAWREVADNPLAEVPFSRRVEKSPWMQLVVVVANGAYDSAGRPLAPQELPVGRGPVTLRVARPGYLYGFANDAWGFYGNNRGSVALTVRRTV